MAKRRVFISDVHMSTNGVGHYPHRYHWLGDQQIANCASFLAALRADRPDELVILGDLLDNWVVPFDLVPPTMGEILASEHNRPIIAGINALLDAGVKVLYFGGNHDQLVTDQELLAAMPRLTVATGWLNNSIYRDGCIHAEHGSSQAMFNGPDPLHDPRTRLPLGYYITRATATQTARTGKEGRNWACYLDDALETLLTSQSLAESVLEAVLEEARIPVDAPIAMLTGAHFTFAEVKRRYASLYDDWVAAHRGFGSGLRGLLAEFEYLDDMADQICKHGGVRIVVLGHSHVAQLDKDRWFAERIYANSGSWCENEGWGTYAEVHTTTAEHIVRTVRWQDGKGEILAEQQLPKP